MTLVKYNPIRTLASLDNFFDSFFNDMLTPETIWRPHMDVIETEKDYQVKFVLPGFDRKDIKVSLKDGVLEVKAERKEEKEEKGRDYLIREIATGTFSRRVELPDNIKTDAVSAEYKNGILSLTLPKKEESLPREVEVKVK